MRRIALIAGLLTMGACQCGPGDTPRGGDGGAIDAGVGDAGRSLFDAGGATDGGLRGDSGVLPDAGTPSDAGGEPDGGRESDSGSTPSDAGSGTDSGSPVDSGVPDAGPFQIDIFISNTCVVSTSPADVSAPLNSQLMLEFHNRSVDYAADVWSSRTYGYLGLVTGGVWDDPIPHCGGPMPYIEYFDVSIAGGPTDGCPGYRFNIHCQ
jgi:hypothetical protein